MKIPYPLVPAKTITVQFNEETTVYEDDVMKITVNSILFDGYVYPNYYFEVYYRIQFVGDYIPTDPERLYAISDTTNYKFTRQFEKDGDVYILPMCYYYHNNSPIVHSEAETFTFKWVSGKKIYSLSLGVELSVSSFDSTTFNAKTAISGHINGTAVVGENPFEGEGV